MLIVDNQPAAGRAIGRTGGQLVPSRRRPRARGRATINVLAEHRHAVLLPLDGSNWHRVVNATALLGAIGRACAALLAAHGEAGYALTVETEAYPGIDVIGI